MQALRRLSLYTHTIRYLRPVQLSGRVWHRLYRPAPDLAPAPARRAPDAAWESPARREPSMVAPSGWHFLGETHEVRDAADWDNPAWSRLWRYNLHYFDDLNARDSDARLVWHAQWVAQWLAANPPARGSGWEPYPTSLRMVNWIKWALEGDAVGEGRLDARALASLAVQARWLARRLEVHLLGNHLFANAKALFCAGLFFSGPEAQTWLDTAGRLLQREIGEQILADGGQFERSTMYHALAVEDMLDLLNIARAYRAALPPRWRDLSDAWPARIGSMLGWLDSMSHPDGEIAFFNDAAFGIAPTRAQLHAYALRLGLPPAAGARAGLTHLRDSGYIRCQAGEAVALLDIAPVGPDYLPGHAHADTLSFELSVQGQRVIVNGGTSTYAPGAERERQRGTAAHSTVVIGDNNSSETWSSFRVARRARPFGLRIDEIAGAMQVAASHDGYRRLPGAPVHRRTWRMDARHLEVADTIEGGSGAAATAYFHLHPAIEVRALDQHGCELHWPGCARPLRVREPGGALALRRATWHPRFGAAEPAQSLTVELRGGASTVNLEWA